MRGLNFGFEFKFKVLKNSSCKKRISPSGEGRDNVRDEEEILITRVSN
jgi:hypothetical protein